MTIGLATTRPHGAVCQSLLTMQFPCGTDALHFISVPRAVLQRDGLREFVERYR